MTNSIPSSVTFGTTQLSITDHQNRLWLTSSELAKALGYKASDAVSRIYRRNADEFTSDMTETVNLTASGNLTKDARIFSPRGCHLIAMFSRTDKAKAFRKWVLDVLDQIVTPEPQFQIPQFPKREGHMPPAHILGPNLQNAIKRLSAELAMDDARRYQGMLTESAINERIQHEYQLYRVVEEVRQAQCGTIVDEQADEAMHLLRERVTLERNMHLTDEQYVAMSMDLEMREAAWAQRWSVAPLQSVENRPAKIASHAVALVQEWLKKQTIEEPELRVAALYEWRHRMFEFGKVLHCQR